MYVDKVLNILDEKKAVNIVKYDTSSYKNRMSDVCIVASGTSSRHMQSVADYVYKQLKCDGFSPYIEGNAKSGWVLIEANGLELHLFKPELREYYNIEELVRSGKKPINTES